MAQDKRFGRLLERVGGRVGSPAISVIADGRMALNSSAAKAFSAAGVKAVLMFWNEETSKMFMKATVKGDLNSYAVSIAANTHSGSLRAKAMLELMGWDPEHQRETLPAIWDAKDKVLEIPVPKQFLIAAAK